MNDLQELIEAWAHHTGPFRLNSDLPDLYNALEKMVISERAEAAKTCVVALKEDVLTILESNFFTQSGVVITLDETKRDEIIAAVEEVMK